MSSFEAFWIPEPETWDEYYPPEVGIEWLRTQSGTKALLVPTHNNARFLRTPGSIKIATKRTRRVWTASSVLVCFPSPELLELAERYGIGRICVGDNGSLAVSAWVEKYDAEGLVPAGWSGTLPDRSLPGIPEDAQEELRSLVAFDGHNSFVSGDGKVLSIRALRRINQSHPHLESQHLEAWVLANTTVSPGGAERLRGWLDEIRTGKRHLDYMRRPI